MRSETKHLYLRGSDNIQNTTQGTLKTALEIVASGAVTYTEHVKRKTTDALGMVSAVRHQCHTPHSVCG
uniref:Uncharacterized protein n=1 Tax=Ficedula albicollis TaxID=59894 RepID=A0A803VNT8_FICAL